MLVQEQEEELRASSSDYMTGSTSLPDPASLDKKALRKEKNRASAAASRARREAYTQSLEEEVPHVLLPQILCDIFQCSMHLTMHARSLSLRVEQFS